MKVGYVLLDGCADRPDRRLNYTTPLQAAFTPNLDIISSSSRLGSVVTVGEGIAPESDIAVFSMLGYSFEGRYPGRGVIEAVGAGLEFRDGWLALRANFASCSGTAIVDRRAGRNLTDHEARKLAEEVNGIKLKDAEFRFVSTVGYRGVLVIMSDVPLSAEISNTDPAYTRVGGFGAAVSVKEGERVALSVPLTEDPRAKRAASLVNEFTAKAAKVLSSSRVNKDRVSRGKLPANCVLLRDAGDHLPKVQPFEQKYGMAGTALVDMPVEVGIAKLLGMKIVETGERSDVRSKGEVFVREIAEGRVVYAHMKGPDEFGHDGDPVGKKKSIERIDSDFFSLVSEKLRDARIVVSCDHSTPCSLMMHSPDPVPLLVSQTSNRDSMRFTEKNSRHGSLGRLVGREVLRTALSLR